MYPRQPAPERPDWFDLAACRGKPVDWWFPSDANDPTEAKAVCHRCPVREECLEFALPQKTLVGVWGGFGDRARQRIRAERKWVELRREMYA